MTVQIRERHQRNFEIKYNLVFISVILTFFIIGYTSHALFIVKLVTLGVFMIFLAMNYLILFFTDESLFSMMYQRIKRDFKALREIY